MVTSPSGTAKSGSPFETALEGRAPLDARLRSTPRTYKSFSDYGGSPRGQRKSVCWQEVEELECPLAASQVPCMAVPIKHYAPHKALGFRSLSFHPCLHQRAWRPLQIRTLHCRKALTIA